MASYLVQLFHPNTVELLEQTDKFHHLEYARTLNSVGTLKMRLPGTFNIALLAIDTRLAVWRDNVLDTGTVWLVREIDRVLTADGEQVIEVTAFSALDIIRRRIVAYAAASAEASKSAEADDLIKAIVRENFGALATDTDRDISSYMSVAADESLAPVIGKAFSWRNCLRVIEEVVEQSTEGGTRLYFDVVASTPTALEFRTYTEHRGADQRGAVLIGAEYGNLADIAYKTDHRAELTFIYAAGTGIEDLREIDTAQDDARIGVSVFGRIEGFADARGTATASELTAEAEQALQNARPKITFDGTIEDLPGLRYNVQWGFGDLITVTYAGVVMDVEIETVHVVVNQSGVEQIKTRLRTI
jgi:hypothetical protein